MDNSICKQHSGLLARINALEKDVTGLWAKWNGMQKLLFGIFGAVILNLIVLLLK